MTTDDRLTVERGPWTVAEESNGSELLEVSHEDQDGCRVVSKNLDNQAQYCFDQQLLDAIEAIAEYRGVVGKTVLQFVDNAGGSKLIWPDGDWTVYDESECTCDLHYGDTVLVAGSEHRVGTTVEFPGRAKRYVDNPEHDGKWVFETIEAVTVTAEMLSDSTVL